LNCSVQCGRVFSRTVNKLSRILFCASFFVALPAGQLRAESLGDFFKRLGNSFAHPQKHPSPARNRAAKPRGTGETLGSPSPSATPPPTAEPTVRTASVVTEARNSRRDVPYGIPVADKPGFVTSPYSPDQGLVDVRGIPSGTEVKDPYTGKVFLRP
jgi:hypothetical protein